VSLNLKQGDKLALIGANGAGKTSLLKLLAGIYVPSRGTIKREGMVGCLLDFRLGMDQEATGYENIILSSMLRGYPPSKLDRIVSDIVEFCELEDFLYMPLRTYSAGMRTRLAYAITTSIVPDILLIDEVFNAGDAAFVDKSVKRMTKVIESSSIFVFATHNLGLAQRLCDRGLFLRDGEITFDGPIEEAIEFYRGEQKR
jgi:ABC-type polysaccharide/polyol phosphate transport system ATPase subunit